MNVPEKPEIVKKEIRPISMKFVLSFHGNENIDYVCRHRVTKSGIGLGTIVQKESVARLLKELIGDDKENVMPKSAFMIPPNVLLDSSSELIWYRPSEVRTMWFRMGEPFSIDVKWPSLIFKMNKNSRKLMIAAQATNQRPTLKTKLYHAPLMNIYETLKLCYGSAAPPNRIAVDTISEIEACLYDSAFAGLHSIDSRLDLKHYTDNKAHVNFYKAKARAQSKVYAHEMIPWGTFEDFFNE